VAGGFANAATPTWADECAAMDDDAARLACYDSHNPPHKNIARAPASTNPPAAAAPIPKSGSDFGLAEKRQRTYADAPKAGPDELTAHVASVSRKLTGELLLKLDNGQSWVQAQRKSGVFIKAGERVTIARGTFGSYLLSSDSGATMRVRRQE
jgi:hypothetical protein